MDTDSVTVTISGTNYERLRFILDVMDGSPDEHTRTEQDVVRFALIVAQIVIRSPELVPLVSAARTHLNNESRDTH